MMTRRLLLAIAASLAFGAASAQTELAPAVPDLSLPAEPAPVESALAEPAPQPVAAVQPAAPAPKKAARRASAPRKASASRARKAAVPPVTSTANKANNEVIEVENLMPASGAVQAAAVPTALPPQVRTLSAQAVTPPAAPAQPVPAAAAMRPTDRPIPIPTAAPVAPAAEGFVPARETAPAPKASNALKVAYNPPTDRDPTLSPDDTLLLKHREEERLRALEMERQRKIEAERRRLAELERQRQLELERLRDPSREVRGKIRINGIIGQEVFIGNKVYGVGKSIYGARIVRVLPDAVVFTYKGQRFTKKVQLK